MSDTPAAFVTGASSGIGRAIASNLAAQGYRLLLGYHSGHHRICALTAELASRYGTDSSIVQVDLRDPSAATQQANSAIRGFGELTCLINNAGINDRSPASNLDPARAVEVFSVNALTPIALASTVGNMMRENNIRGSIVNVTSIHETVPLTGGALYCASKAALGMATKVLALEFAPFGIRVNSLAPGETATAMNGVTDERDYRSIDRPEIPLHRPAGVDEIASAAAFLVGSQSTYITGTSMLVDGGLALMAAEANARYAHPYH